MNFEQGKKLVKFARTCLFSNPEPLDLYEVQGIFVTINCGKDLRGCMGLPETKLPLKETILTAAKSAAFHDSRFPPIKESELDELTFEVSILTKPELIEVKDSEDYLKKIEIGKDGLTLECERFYALLLPTVAVEHKFTPTQFLENLCLKAGLIAETWKQKKCKISKFQAKVFKEESPEGEIIECH